MILVSQIFDVTANENARYKRNELEFFLDILGRVKKTGSVTKRDISRILFSIWTDLLLFEQAQTGVIHNFDFVLQAYM